ncbi:lysostaphin resistance A-like protein [Dietzia sp. 179-F 9C3 NHS]|uniref:lysostaphin resistance A-like protein n=1 Tax=Dietzia sp. 179-F 9C3 NHS TaxID=3374295 RepID=UPI00387A538C
MPPPPSPPAAGTVTSPGLWTTPIRGRVALAAIAWVALYGLGAAGLVVLGMVGMRVAGAGRPDPAILALVVVWGSSLAVLLAVRVHLLRRRTLTWADVGLRAPARSPAHLAWQIPAVMLAGAIASVLVLAPFGQESADEQQGLGDLLTGGPVVAVLGLLGVAVLVPIVEEVVFRGIVLPALRARFQPVTGLVLAGAVFAVVHVLPPALPYLLVVGIALCGMAEWYRSIVPGIVLHGVNNAIVFGSLLTTL